MIIKLTLKPETQITLPLNYNYYIQSMIYRTLQDAPKYSTFLHDYGYSCGRLKFRMFTFSGLCGKHSIENKMITFHDIIHLEIRSASEEFIFHLHNAFNRRKAITLKGTELNIVSVQIKKQLILPYQINIHTVAPIVASKALENGNTQYFSPLDNDFESIINNNFKKKFNAFYGIIPMEDITLYNKSENPRHIVTKYHDTIINAYHGEFILSGNPQYLQFLYDTGLGAKNAQGFGMFELN